MRRTLSIFAVVVLVISAGLWIQRALAAPCPSTQFQILGTTPPYYNPSSCEVDSGTSVTWTNTHTTTHTATANNGSFDTGNVGRGATSGPIQLTNNGPAPITLSYHCNIHSSMVASVTVNPASSSPSPSPSPSPSQTKPTATPTRTSTNTPTPTPTPSPSPTQTPTASPSNTLSPGSPLPFGASPTDSPSASPSPQAGSQDEDGGAPVGLIVGIVALVLAAGAGVGLWLLRRTPA